MSDKVQLGLRVDRELYEEFKKRVKDRRGRWQGVAGDELENAMRYYIHFGADKPLPDLFDEFNDRLQRIEGAIGTAPADGGVDTFEGDEHTHAPSSRPATPTEKPAANAATEKKIRWLADCVRDRVGGSDGEFEEVPRAVLVSTVKDEYGFRKDTAKRYVDELVSFFDLVDHPTADGVHCTPERQEQLIQNHEQ